MSLTVLIGGARSGKSSLAVDIGRRYQADCSGPVSFIATAPASDDDMRQRIERHINERPADWQTIQEQLNLSTAVDAVPEGLIIIDCLTLWTSNLMWDGRSDQYIRNQATTDAANVGLRSDPVVVITNEVGLGIVPENALARRYRDAHGFVNQEWAAAADTVLHLVAGRATKLEDPWTLLDDFQ
ncbi:bifunctional adenosylcobinamide kinase/adenosylcobinamide-phosphate guanylyltransferase [uncultured Ilumatobacter sp.]|jgi:adenosyl cobinamide kinase/adenosyl cobinamide phosphate guanylyltransferase|uniref:bifunctional adenosylcobinamide kinase/adenosylcobinamide-phosphate guanylyltransferase n=1 Tax=Ilumatobacter sp. TaxID=1967498 RepID=UPI00309680F7|tara:strand:+ start:465 stop:1016 length:552 start_codon:yes stop_codon:yes gene_type:complete